MRLCTLFIILLTHISAALGLTNSSFYVATTGEDSNPGRRAAPWRSIQHAADSARAGSTVYVRGGIYVNGGARIRSYAAERGHTEHSTAVNNTLYENDMSATGSGEFQMQWNMVNNVFENNIVYAGARCLITPNRSQVDKNHPPAVIDHNLYYCASGGKTSSWARDSATVTGFDKYVEGREMTVIRSFSIRIFLTLPRATSTCNRIRRDRCRHA